MIYGFIETNLKNVLKVFKLRKYFAASWFSSNGLVYLSNFQN